MPYNVAQAEEWVAKRVRFLATGLDLALFKQALLAEATALREELAWRGGAEWPE